MIEIKSIDKMEQAIQFAPDFFSANNSKKLALFDIENTILIKAPVGSDTVLVESITPNFIMSLQNNGVHCIALSASRTGLSSGVNIEKWRYQELLKSGIEFNTWDREEIIFEEYSCIYGNHPIFYNGVLCTNKESKGLILVNFLKRINWVPDMVAFFEDTAPNIEEVYSHLLQLNPKINMWGFHYLGKPD